MTVRWIIKWMHNVCVVLITKQSAFYHLHHKCIFSTGLVHKTQAQWVFANSSQFNTTIYITKIYTKKKLPSKFKGFAPTITSFISGYETVKLFAHKTNMDLKVNQTLKGRSHRTCVSSLCTTFPLFLTTFKKHDAQVKRSWTLCF